MHLILRLHGGNPCEECNKQIPRVSAFVCHLCSNNKEKYHIDCLEKHYIKCNKK